jgi:succinate dehydrogenase / fumarate reductase flavoprotein subunit
VYLDIASRRSKEFILTRLPSMPHQFKELANVDITVEPMEIGPTCHYVMGGVEVDPDTAAANRVPGLFAAGEVAGGMHGSNRLGGNSLSDLLVFGQRAGLGAAAYIASLGGNYPQVSAEVVEEAVQTALAPFEGGAAAGTATAKSAAENPYTLHQELQQTMNDLVGIIRTADELRDALARLPGLRARAEHLSVEGHRQFNPGWHLALDLRNMLLVSECVARAALAREESRGGHTRDDFPTMRPPWRTRNLICALADHPSDTAAITLTEQPNPQMRDDLIALFERSELGKYLTDEEMSALPDEVK